MYIFGYHRAGSDGYIVADCHSRQDSHTSSDPDIIADRDRLRPFFAGVPFNRIRAVTGRIDAYIRPDEAIISYSDFRFIQYGEVEIGKKASA